MEWTEGEVTAVAFIGDNSTVVGWINGDLVANVFLMYRDFRIFFIGAGVMEPSGPLQIQHVGVNMPTANTIKMLMVLQHKVLSMALTCCSISQLVKQNPKSSVILTAVSVKAWLPQEW